MKYVNCSVAKDLKGLRVILSTDGPNPWCEAAKNIFSIRNVDYVAVARTGMEGNEDLYEWTGQRNSPVAMYENEKPRHTWIDILYLAERLGRGPSLIPSDREDQIKCIGISHLICGEDGLGWNRRLNIYKNMADEVGGDYEKIPLPRRLFKDYRIDHESATSGTIKFMEIMKFIDEHISIQSSMGSRYLVGDKFTAADIYFACMFTMIDPLPQDLCPISHDMRVRYCSGEAHVRKVITPRLVKHRDFIYNNHLALPIDFTAD